jgi:hypothetical protein
MGAEVLGLAGIRLILRSIERSAVADRSMRLEE